MNVCEKRCQVTNVKTNDGEHLCHELKHFGLDVVRQAGGKVEVEGKFSSSIVFSSNYHDNKVCLEIKNVENTESQIYELDSSSITDNFFDGLDSYVLCDENAFIRHIKIQEHTAEREYYEHSLAQGELPMTEVMDAPLLRELFSNQQRLFLTYHEKIKEVRSDDDGILIGRGTNSDLLVPSNLASRKHARIVYRKGKFIVSDHSTNGTFIKCQNGKEVYIHGEDYPLTGSGFISLGESSALDNDHLIYFSCQEC
ncbi:MAG: FHA domain-containing protein [Halobacteria archaeon]|nr:FHA domain-containing protein [Halobacteria archaeon]